MYWKNIAKSSIVLCSTIVNETVQYYTKNGGKPIYMCVYYSLMLPRHLTKWHLMCYLMNCVIVPCVRILPSYYIIFTHFCLVI